ncbi:MAG: hypothetical protein ACRD4B_07590, partial [Acidobacteriota bacterium]
MKPPCFRSISNVSLFLLVLLSLSSADAVQVTRVIVGVDGYARAERWVPVVFDLHNEGQRFRGKIQVRKGQTVFEKSLDLGESSKKRIELLYYHTNAYESLRYLILDPEGATLREGNLEPRMLNYRDNLLLVISTHEYDHQFLNGQENPWGGKTYVAYYKPRELFSEWMGFSSADGIALGSLSPGQMLPAQWKAIGQHVASGGVLIFSAITDFAVLQDPIYKNHLPRISPAFNQISHADFLVSTWVKNTTDPFPQVEIPAQFVVKRDCDRELISLPAGSSLVTSSPYYKGSIIYFAFDYTRIPEELRKLFARIWNTTVYPSTPSGDVGLSSRFRQKL